MPWQPLRPCIHPGCRQLLRPGQPCPDHAPAPYATSSYQLARAQGRRLDLTAGQRARILDRDSHRCQLCGRPATDVDHIIPLADGGSDDPDNLRAICIRCHRRRTAQHARARRGKGRLNL